MRRKMISTFDREPNKPINNATVLRALRSAVGSSKFCIGRLLRQRPNHRTFDAVQVVLDALVAGGKAEIEKHGGMRWYFAVRNPRCKGCDRQQERRGDTVRKIRLNARGECAACTQQRAGA